MGRKWAQIRSALTSLILLMAMTKIQPRAENLLMLMEWLRLGRKFHIHKDFLLYLNIDDIAKLCFISKHYLDKYFRFSCFYFIGVNNGLLDQLRMKFHETKMTNLEILKQGGRLLGSVYGNEYQGKQVHILKRMYETNSTLRKTIHMILQKR